MLYYYASTYTHMYSCVYIHIYIYIYIYTHIHIRRRLQAHEVRVHRAQGPLHDMCVFVCIYNVHMCIVLYYIVLYYGILHHVPPSTKSSCIARKDPDSQKHTIMESKRSETNKDPADGPRAGQSIEIWNRTQRPLIDASRRVSSGGTTCLT